jgi:hypothetical protein
MFDGTVHVCVYCELRLFILDLEQDRSVIPHCQLAFSGSLQCGFNATNIEFA